MKIEVITIEFLRECFILDEETGVLTWRERPEHHFACSAAVWNSRYAGKVAGVTDNRGRTRVKINGAWYFAHRIIYAMHHGLCLGSVPDLIDHRDCDVANNRPANLRAATHAENQWNRRGNKLSRRTHKGVVYTPNSRKKWRAHITKHGVRYVLGQFSTEMEAAAAYREAALKLHGDFARF